MTRIMRVATKTTPIFKARLIQLNALSLDGICICLGKLCAERQEPWIVENVLQTDRPNRSPVRLPGPNFESGHLERWLVPSG